MSISAPVASYAPPRLPRGVIRRARLLELLHQHIDKKLLAITASAGYGKTTLLAHLAEEVDFPVCWISLNPWNQDPTAFVEGLVWAIQSRFPEFGQAILARLATTVTSDGDLRDVAVTLLRELEERAHDYFLLVLDDYHLVEGSPTIAAFLDHLITYLPEQAHFVLASRTKPSLSSLPRLVANREALFIPQEALKFTGDEARELLKYLLQAPVSDAEAARINEQCEGWPAALVLIGQGHYDSLPSIHNNSGLLLEYLEEEVAARQSESVRSFLVRTSIFPVLLPELCDILLGTDNAAAILRELARRNLASEESHGAQPVYHYHSLLREFLLQKLEIEMGHRIKDLASLAGKLIEKAGLWQEALEVYCRAGAYDPASDLLERVSPDLARQDRWSTIAQALDRLPDDVLRAHPGLMLRRAEAATEQGNLDAALELVEAVITSSDSRAETFYQAWALLQKSMVLRYKGRVDEAESCCREALHLLQKSKGSVQLLARAHHNLGLTRALSRDFPAARRHLEDALRAYEKLNEIKKISQIHDHLGCIYTEEGNLGSAVAHFNQALRGFHKTGIAWSKINTLNNLGYAYFLMAECDLADEVLSEAVSEASSLSLYRMEAYSLVSLADVMRLQGRHTESLQAYIRGEKLARQCQETRLVVYALEGRALAALQANEAGKADVLLEEASALASQHDSEWQSGLLLISRARVARLEENLDSAKSLLDEALSILGKASAPRDLCRVRVHLAHTHLLSGAEDRARRELEEVGEFLSTRSDPYFLIPDIVDMPELLRLGSRLGNRGGVFRLLLNKAEQVRRSGSGPSQATTPPAAADDSGQYPAVKAQGFGIAQVSVNGQEVTSSQWRSNKAKEMFFLLAYLSRPITKEEIIAALWPEANLEKGESGFKSNLFRARRAIYPESFVHRNGYYQFTPMGEFNFDVSEFLQLMEIAERLPKGADLRPRYFEEAASLYQGPFLPEFYSEWSATERERLASRYLQCLAVLAEYCAEQGRFEQAAQLYQRILDADPYNEGAVTQAIVYYVRARNLPAATNCFRRYTELIEQELDASPSRRLLELYQSVMQAEPEAD